MIDRSPEQPKHRTTFEQLAALGWTIELMNAHIRSEEQAQHIIETRTPPPKPNGHTASPQVSLPPTQPEPEQPQAGNNATSSEHQAPPRQANGDEAEADFDDEEYELPIADPAAARIVYDAIKAMRAGTVDKLKAISGAARQLDPVTQMDAIDFLSNTAIDILSNTPIGNNGLHPDAVQAAHAVQAALEHGQKLREKLCDRDNKARQPGEDRGGDDSEADDDIPSVVDDEQIKADRKEVKSALQAAIEEFNRKYCVVNDGGSALIFMDRYDEALKRQVYDRMRQSSFVLLHKNDHICTSISPEGKRTYKPMSSVWLADKGRRDYKKGVVFDPTTTESRNGYLNLWRGFGFTPCPGQWKRMKDHIRENVCSGNEGYFDYLTGWMARAVRFAADQGEVSVVMRGGRAVGKGILGHALRRLFGQHGMYISKSKHLVGAFNAHLRDCAFLFADEAFFAGDKSAEGTLKSLITEETLTIEPKGQNVILCKNHLHIVMASNEKWVVPAGLDERRFFVLDVSDAHQGDHPYFEAIIKEMESGGYAAMLHDLLNYDISKFNVRRVPGTAALDDQKKLTLPLESITPSKAGGLKRNRQRRL